MGDLDGVYAEKANAEFGLITGDGDEGVTISYALHFGDEGEGSGGTSNVVDQGGSEKRSRSQFTSCMSR